MLVCQWWMHRTSMLPTPCAVLLPDYEEEYTVLNWRSVLSWGGYCSLAPFQLKNIFLNWIACCRFLLLSLRARQQRSSQCLS